MHRLGLLLLLALAACDRDPAAGEGSAEAVAASPEDGPIRWDGWIREHPQARPIDAIPRGATALLGTGWLVEPSGHLEGIEGLPDGTLVTLGTEIVAWDRAAALRLVLAPGGRPSNFDLDPVSGSMAIFEEHERAELLAARAGRSVFRLPRLEDVRGALAAGERAVVARTDTRELARYEADRDEPVWTHRAPGVISALAISPDRTRVALAANRGLEVLDAGSGARLHSLEPTGQHVFALAFSPDGTRLAVGGGDSDTSVRVWSLSGATSLSLLGHAGRVTDLLWLDDGRLLSTGYDQTVRLWALDADMPLVWESRPWSRNGIQRLWLVNEADVPHGLNERAELALEAGADRVWVSGWGAAARAIRLADGTVEPRAGHDAWVSHLAFSADGQILASGDWSGGVILWDAATGQLRHHLLGTGTRIRELYFEGDALVAITREGQWRWGVQDGQPRGVTPTAALNGAASIAFADEQTLLIGRFAEVVAVDPRTGVPLASVATGRNQWVEVGVDARGGRWALGTFSDLPLAVLDFDRAIATPIDAGNPRRLSFAPAAGRLAFSGGGPEVPVVAVIGTDGAVVRTYDAWAEALALSPAGDRLAVQTVDEISIVPIPEGEPATLPFTGPGRSMGWSADGQRLEVATEAGAFFWDGRSEPDPISSEPTQVVASGPGGLYARLALDGRLTLQTWPTGSEERELGRLGTAVYPRHPARLAWSPTGTLLAVLDEAGGVTIWETRTGDRILAWEGDPPATTSPSFRLFEVDAPDGQHRLVEMDEGGFELRRGEAAVFTWLAGSDRHRRAATAAFSPTGDTFAVAFADTTIAVYPISD